MLQRAINAARINGDGDTPTTGREDNFAGTLLRKIVSLRLNGDTIEHLVVIRIVAARVKIFGDD